MDDEEFHDAAQRIESLGWVMYATPDGSEYFGKVGSEHTQWEPPEELTDDDIEYLRRQYYLEQERVSSGALTTSSVELEEHDEQREGSPSSLNGTIARLSLGQTSTASSGISQESLLRSTDSLQNFAPMELLKRASHHRIPSGNSLQKVSDKNLKSGGISVPGDASRAPSDRRGARLLRPCSSLVSFSSSIASNISV